MSDASSDNTKWTELGYISGVSGVKGWVKLYSYTRPRENIKDYRCFYEQPNRAKSLAFSDIKSSGKYIIGKVPSVDDRNQAEELVGKKLWIRTADLKKSKNEFFWHELIGLTVVNVQGESLGKVTELMETGVNDVLVVCSDQFDSPILIPYALDHYVLDIDLATNKLTVDWQLDWQLDR